MSRIKQISKKIFFCIFFTLGISITSTYVVAYTNIINEVKEVYDLDDTVNILNEYLEDVDLQDAANNLLKGETLGIKNILDIILNLFLKEIKVSIKTFVRLFIILVLFAIVKCLELEKDSISKIVDTTFFLVITATILKNYTENIQLFKTTIETLITIIEVVSPLILTLLIATGEIVTSGIVGPTIMFLTALIGAVTSYIVLPLLNIMLIFKIISGISETINLEKMANFIGKFAMWGVSIAFTIVLGVLGLESSVSTSVDSVTVKTTQAAVSNLVPVVGKFVSDSAELVMGASEVIGKTIGVLGVIVIAGVLIAPALKLILIGLIYGFLESISETLIKENNTIKIIGAFSKQYTTLAGIMIGIGTAFIITLAIAINLFGKAVAS